MDKESLPNEENLQEEAEQETYVNPELEAQKEWYVLHTYSGYENKVKQNLELRKESMNMENNIFDIMVPTEDTTEVKNGVEKTIEHKIFPGYVLVQMVMSDQAWYIVRNTPGVTGFVGSHGAGSKPAPLLPEEVQALLEPADTKSSRHKPIDLEIGEHVTISDGAFQGMEGVVLSTDEDKGKVDVSLEVFNRETTAELDYSQISKIYNQ